MSENYPLISCICISNGSVALLKRAITCFQSQNYPNKELVISYFKNDHQVKTAIQNLSEDQKVQLLTIEKNNKQLFGDASNNALSLATGDYICLWNNEDWYHPSRLWFQYNSIQGTRYDASVLNRVMLYDSTTQKAYLSSSHPLYGSLLCRKEVTLAHPFDHLNKGEDASVIKFLLSKNLLFYMDDCPFLYAYVYDGKKHKKYWDDNQIFHKSELLNRELTNTIHNLLDVT